MSLKIQELPNHIKNLYLANNQAVWLVGDEPYAYQTAIQEAAKLLKEERKEEAEVINYDCYGSFYRSVPNLVPPKDGTAKPLNALPLMAANAQQMKTLLPSGANLPFDPRKNIIFVLKNLYTETFVPPDGLKIAQFLENWIQSNMGSDSFYSGGDEGSRGKRLLVFITPTDKACPQLPELKPTHMALPDVQLVKRAITNVMSPLVAAHQETKGKSGLPAVTSEQESQLVPALTGMPYQAIEDSLAFSIGTHRSLKDMDAVVRTIENQKSNWIAGIQGLTYISKDKLVGIQLPGYQKAEEFILDRVGIDETQAAKHDIKQLRGLALGGRPGCGKTMFGKLVAKLTNRVLLLLSLGEIQGSLVGQSEANLRRAITIAQAMRAVVLVDDVDKAGANSATSGYSGDGGVFGRLIQMLLTETSDPANEAVWIYTFNRAQNVPGELFRAGRIDERYFIQTPDPATRLDILKVHITKRNFPLPDNSMLDMIAHELTEDWVGAEVESIVERTAIKAVRNSKETLDGKLLAALAKEFIPMARQSTYAEDITMMEKMCEGFTKIGRSDVVEEKAGGSTRAKRGVKI